MWIARSRFMRSTIAASVEDLPDPVGPVTSTMPRRKETMSPSDGGSPRSSNVGIDIGMSRMTIEQWPRCRKMFTRNRATPSMA
jgi:hypothetical protein